MLHLVKKNFCSCCKISFLDLYDFILFLKNVLICEKIETVNPALISVVYRSFVMVCSHVKFCMHGTYQFVPTADNCVRIMLYEVKPSNMLTLQAVVYFRAPSWHLQE